MRNGRLVGRFRPSSLRASVTRRATASGRYVRRSSTCSPRTGQPTAGTGSRTSGTTSSAAHDRDAPSVQPLLVLDDLDDAGRRLECGDRSPRGRVDSNARGPGQLGLVPGAWSSRNGRSGGRRHARPASLARARQPRRPRRPPAATRCSAREDGVRLTLAPPSGDWPSPRDACGCSPTRPRRPGTGRPGDR